MLQEIAGGFAGKGCMTSWTQHWRRFLRDERGFSGVSTYVASTMAISLPLGFMFYQMYLSLCDGGRYANYLLGLF